MRRRVLLGCVAAVLLAGCGGIRPFRTSESAATIELVDEVKQVESQILQILKGSPVDDARRIMRENKFSWTPVAKDGSTYYECTIERPRSFWVADLWTVSIFAVDGKVDHLSVARTLVEPKDEK
jgi:CBS domain-containing protein